MTMGHPWLRKKLIIGHLKPMTKWTLDCPRSLTWNIPISTPFSTQVSVSCPIRFNTWVLNQFFFKIHFNGKNNNYEISTIYIGSFFWHVFKKLIFNIMRPFVTIFIAFMCKIGET
jgi:hypothetical protein